jgi:hypothetical protein
VLSTTADMKGLIAEAVVKRLEQLGGALRVPVAVKVG